MALSQEQQDNIVECRDLLNHMLETSLKLRNDLDKASDSEPALLTWLSACAAGFTDFSTRLA